MALENKTKSMISVDPNNVNFKLAYDFVNHTNCSLYLTGKAGTGKTTFLKYVKQHCTKNLVIVAPTGVAAINAGGVTMHSFFQLPFGPFLPDASIGFGLNEGVVDKNTLFKNLKLNGTKRKLIEELQLLIIDEVSMLRSDTLDAIDTILKVFRKSKKPFGGVQVLFIGDLHQLPPVVRDTEKQLLDKVYASPFFFDAMVLQENTLVYIELKKIYRQNEQSFIDLLNKLRHNQLEEIDYNTLNNRYDPGFEGKDDHYITLTTHNHKADVINQEELDKLPTKLFAFEGEVKGDFGEKQLPAEYQLRLKEGAQVMFVKNDSSLDKKYYNGKIGVISKVYSDSIYVRFPDTGKELEVIKESWENIHYTLNKETHAIDEKVVGEFIQYPLRLAWAITIHKSQGLTFEKAIIDAGQSFAPGQVYVALSRCTSLEGIVLHSRITEMSLHTDERILSFIQHEQDGHVLLSQLQQEQFKYQSEKVMSIFDWQYVLDAMYELEHATLISKNIPEAEKAVAMTRIFIVKVKEQKTVADKFRLQIDAMLNEIALTRNTNLLKERVTKGIDYFINSLYHDIFQTLSEYIKSLNGNSKLKKYTQLVMSIYDTCWFKISELQECTLNEEKLIPESKKRNKIIIDLKPVKITKGSSSKESLAYFAAGKSIEEIASIRGMAVSTIEKHLTDFIRTGELDVDQILSKERIAAIKIAYTNSDDKSSTNLKQILNHEFSYSEIRMVLSHLHYTKEV